MADFSPQTNLTVDRLLPKMVIVGYRKKSRGDVEGDGDGYR